MKRQKRTKSRVFGEDEEEYVEVKTPAKKMLKPSKKSEKKETKKLILSEDEEKKSRSRSGSRARP